MGRRWVCEIKGTAAGGSVYLRRHSFFAGMPGHPDDEPEILPVTIPYASKFKTKREAEELAKSRGFADFKVVRTWF